MTALLAVLDVRGKVDRRARGGGVEWSEDGVGEIGGRARRGREITAHQGGLGGSVLERNEERKRQKRKKRQQRKERERRKVLERERERERRRERRKAKENERENERVRGR